jgi:hypothetical protein
MKRSRLFVALYLSLVFLSGALVGILGYRFYTAQTVRARTRPGSPEEMRRQYAEEMRSRLKLSPPQFQQLNQILKATGDRFREMQKKYRPEVKSIMDAQTEAIRSLLNDTQRAEYEKMRQERDQHRSRHPGPK